MWSTAYSAAVGGANLFRLNLLKVPPSYHGSSHVSAPGQVDSGLSQSRLLQSHEFCRLRPVAPRKDLV